jgi:uncharacterized protein
MDTDRPKARRGFASMSPEKQREIASKGGRMAHQKGAAHKWTVAEAREAGRKGGCARHGHRVVTPPESVPSRFDRDIAPVPWPEV